MKAGWQIKKFSDVCELKKGRKPNLSSAPSGGGKPYLVAKYLRGSEPIEFASVLDRNSILVEPHEIIIICDGSNSGETFIGFDGILSSTMAKIAHGVEFDNKFLMYFLDSLFEQFNAAKTGSAIPHLDLAALREQHLPVPLLPEQQRIVGILDDAFDGIATATATAEQNLQNARALFESHLQSVFTQRGEGWVEKLLEEVVTTDCSLSYGVVQPGEEYADGLPIVRPTDLTSKVIRLDGLKRIDPKLAEGYKRTALRGGELLLCVRGSTGVISIASAELAGGNVTRGIVPIRFDEDILAQDFGYYLLSSGEIQSQIRAKTYGAALMQINIRDLRNIAVSFPRLKEQAEITAKLDALREETQRLESLYQRKLAALDELKKSLLHQAFSGML